MSEMDEIDWKILSVLQDNANLANTELADAIGLTPAPCLRRVKRLTDLGIIKGYTVALDPKQLGFTMSALVEVTMTQHTTTAVQAFLTSIENKPEIIACHMVTGDCDFVLRVMTRDIESYRRLIWDELHMIQGVQKVRSTVILETFKDRLNPALGRPRPRSKPGSRPRG